MAVGTLASALALKKSGLARGSLTRRGRLQLVRTLGSTVSLQVQVCIPSNYLRKALLSRANNSQPDVMNKSEREK